MTSHADHLASALSVLRVVFRVTFHGATPMSPKMADVVDDALVMMADADLRHHSVSMAIEVRVGDAISALKASGDLQAVSDLLTAAGWTGLVERESDFVYRRYFAGKCVWHGEQTVFAGGDGVCNACEAASYEDEDEYAAA
jgi:hypothetical protein